MSCKSLADYHIHTAVSIDCQETLPAICESASALGLTEVAITNHLMVTNPDYCIQEYDLIALNRQILQMTERFPGIKIRLGLEVDYLKDKLEIIEWRIQKYERVIGRPFDLILGSVHVLRGIHFSSSVHAPALFADCRPVEVFREYFRTMEDAVRCGMFSIMAHPDLIKKYTYDLYDPVPFSEFAEEAEGFVMALVQNGVGLELNTKGLDCPVREIYPSSELLSLYINRTGQYGSRPIITLGSDAHQAGNVGRKFDKAQLFLSDAGGTGFAGWQEGQVLFDKFAVSRSV
ncbi:MAG: histidinol-phosphatase HisJ family protein [Anaerolineales bacterium]|nr:histidinol-phosphatase HisJ family protein [Anaerolineales bacterium]